MNRPRSTLPRRRLGLLVLASLALTLGVRTSEAHGAAAFLPAQTLTGTGAGASGSADNGRDRDSCRVLATPEI